MELLINVSEQKNSIHTIEDENKTDEVEDEAFR